MRTVSRDDDAFASEKIAIVQPNAQAMCLLSSSLVQIYFEVCISDASETPVCCVFSVETNRRRNGSLS